FMDLLMGAQPGAGVAAAGSLDLGDAPLKGEQARLGYDSLGEQLLEILDLLRQQADFIVLRGDGAVEPGDLRAKLPDPAFEYRDLALLGVLPLVEKVILGGDQLRHGRILTAGQEIHGKLDPLAA